VLRPVALSALVAEIAAWQGARGRDHQAAAARRGAADVTRLVLAHAPAARPARTRAPRGGTAGHGAHHHLRVEGRGGPAVGRTESPP
jgi:hypothetical protein